MPFTIYKETKGQRYFKLLETLHITKDGRAVKENDPAGVRVLGSAGGLVSEDDAKKYKLDASQIETEGEPYVPPPAPEAKEEAKEEPVGVIEVPEDLKGKLPDDFPGHAALDAAGIHTYAQLRKAGKTPS